MRHFIYFFIRFAKLLFSSSARYLRLTPCRRGKIFFYDKIYKTFFSVSAREHIDSGTADQIFTNNNYDLRFLQRYGEIIEIYNNICEQNMRPIIIDCGANIGFSSIHFSTTFPKAVIVSIEPEKNNFLLMKKNCNGLDNIEFLNKAIGATDGFVNIDNADAGNNAFRTSRSENNEGDIEVVLVSSILKSHKNCVPFIIKIDIEGFEKDLFSSNTEWVEKVPLLIIETHDWMLPKESNSHNFLNVITKLRRDFVHRGENIFSISNN